MAHKILTRSQECPYCHEIVTLTDLEIINAITGKTNTFTQDGRVLVAHNCPDKGNEIVWIAF